MTRKPSIQDGYVPLDELLEQPLSRVLRTLRWFDWASTAEIFNALNASDDERPALTATVMRAHGLGLLERGKRVLNEGYFYRLTASGREELARRLAGISPTQLRARGRKRRAA